MILIIFSDIHGNIYSLEKAISEMEKYNPDQFLFLGDMMGYYYHPNECIDLLSRLDNLISIKGNHDSNFLKAMNSTCLLEKYAKKYGQSYQILNKSITTESLDFLNNLKDCEKNSLYEAYHGSPNNYLEEYIYPDNTNIDLGEISTPFLFTGHTHYPMQKKIKDTLIVNPGSIGQPRDLNKPSFAIVDTKEMKTEIVRYQYNKRKLINKISALNDKPYLIDVLTRNKNEK